MLDLVDASSAAAAPPCPSSLSPQPIAMAPPPPRLYSTKSFVQAKKAIKRAHLSTIITAVKKKIEFAKFKADRGHSHLSFAQVQHLYSQDKGLEASANVMHRHHHHQRHSPPALTEQSPSPTLATSILKNNDNTATSNSTTFTSTTISSSSSSSYLLNSPPFNSFRTPLASPEPSFRRPVASSLLTSSTQPRSRCTSASSTNGFSSNITAANSLNSADGKLLQAWPTAAASALNDPMFPTPETSPTRMHYQHCQKYIQQQHQQQQQQQIKVDMAAANHHIRSKVDDEEGALMLLQMAGVS